MSATLGLLSAIEGYNTLVLTIDPARRLAGAFGVKEFPLVEEDVTELVKGKGVPIKGRLFIRMLKPHRVFQELVEEVVPSPERRERIFSSPIDWEITRSLSGTSEYAAIRELYRLTQKGVPYERIILDTPPTTQAIHFLSAPSRLKEFFSSGWLSLFLGAGVSTGFRFFRRGTDLLLKGMERLSGKGVLGEIARFVELAQEVIRVYEGEIGEAEKLLFSPRTGFVLVAVPSPLQMEDLKVFARTLGEMKLPVVGVIFNRWIVPLLPQDLALPPPYEFLTSLDRLGREQQKIMEEFSQTFSIPVVKVPAFSRDLHSMEGLLEILSCFEKEPLPSS
jgi:anion-transporting  ArsA/GET3 family ATPase